MFKRIDKLYKKKISAKGLALFRILFFLTLFLELIWIYGKKELYFDELPFITSSIDIAPYLMVWMVVLVGIILGFATRILAFVNYCFSIYIFNLVGAFAYHMHHVYIGLSFLVIFLPIGSYYALDATIAIRSKWMRAIFQPYLPKVSVLHYFFVILVSLVFVYGDSIFFKFRSVLWTEGLGLWLPASLPQNSIWENQWLLNNEFLIRFMRYTTFVFEGLFTFLFFRKKYRLPIFIIGFLLHLGIFLQFPIPYFGTGFIAIYVLLIPVSFWDKLHEKLFSNKGPRKISMTASSILDEKHKLIGFKFLIVLLLAVQLNTTFNFPLSKSIVNYISENIPSTNTGVAKLSRAKQWVRYYSKHYLGITPHGVFVDNHFNGFNQIYTLKYEDQLLPLYQENGLAGDYLRGALWVNFNFRVNSPKEEIRNNNLAIGLSQYAAFWAHENNINLEKAVFKVLMKKTNIPFHWEKDVLKKNLENPWQEVGLLHWNENKPN